MEKVEQAEKVVVAAADSFSRSVFPVSHHFQIYIIPMKASG